MTFPPLANYYRLRIAIKYTTGTNVIITLSATTPYGLKQVENHSINASANPIGALISSSLVHSNNLVMESNSSINVVELWMRLWKCSSGCTICLNQQLCELCNEPMFMLSYKCVDTCTEFIHFMPNRTCLTSCPNKYY